MGSIQGRSRVWLGIGVAAIGTSLAIWVWLFYATKRPVSDVARLSLCRSSIQTIDVAGTRLRIPNAPPVTVYLQDDLKRNVFRLQSADDAKSLCDATSYGQQPISANSIIFWYFDSFNPWEAARTACAHNRFSWPKAICEIIQNPVTGQASESERPTRVTVFALNTRGDAPTGHDLLSGSTYQEFLRGGPPSNETRDRYDQRVFTYRPSPHALSPDNNPLTARCEPPSADFARCRVTFQWIGKTHVDISFAAQPGDVDRKLLVVRDVADKLLMTLK